MNYAYVGKFVRIFLVAANCILLTIGVSILIAIVSIKLTSDLNKDGYGLLTQIANYGIMTHLHIYLYFVAVLLICVSTIGLYGVLKENHQLLVLYMGLMAVLFFLQIIMLSMLSYGAVSIEKELAAYLNERLVASEKDDSKKHCDFLDAFTEQTCCQTDGSKCCQISANSTSSSANSCSYIIIMKAKKTLTQDMVVTIVTVNFVLFMEFCVLLMVSFLLGKLFFSESADSPDAINAKRNSLFA